MVKRYLWCVRTPEGDHIATPSAADAAELCMAINDDAIRTPDRQPTAVVVEWPGTAEEHAASLDPWRVGA